jgi:hypothetical protein
MVLLLLLLAQVSGILEMCKIFCNVGLGKSVSAFFKDFNGSQRRAKKNFRKMGRKA